MKLKTLSDIIVDALQDEEYFGANGPCPIFYEKGNQDSRILLISGDNASGKSFFCKYLRHIYYRDASAKDAGLEIMDCGMHRRTMSGFQRAMMYGDENRDSSGNISLRNVLTGIRTCEGRANPHILSLDEPDIGLSEGYAAALGQLLAEFGQNLPEKTVGLIIVTHSRDLAKPLLPLNPHLLRIGDDQRSTATWVAEGPLARTLDDIRNLAGKARETSQKIQSIVNTRQKAETKKRKN